MTVETAASPQTSMPAFAPASRDAIEAAIQAACRKIAPLWPLKHFVAVNPFLGFTGQTFESTCATLKRVASADMLMPRAFYRQAVADGVIEDRDLQTALDAAPLALDLATLKTKLAYDPAPGPRPRAVVATVAEVLDRLARGDRQASRTAFMVDEISKWCAAYFDEGQASWKMPWRSEKPYAAWRGAMRYDRNPEMMGIKGFRAAIAALPEDAVETIAVILSELNIPERAMEDYLHRALFDIQGWAAYARYRVWDNGLYGREDDTLVELLAVRVAWGFALFKERADAAFVAAWREAMVEATALPQDDDWTRDADLAVDLLLQQAYEIAYQRKLVKRLAAQNAVATSPSIKSRPAVQAAFCIDVRSEVYRRAFETVSTSVETVGFAGFFGFPIEYVPIGQTRGGAQCPVLLTPSVIVCEHVGGATEEEEVEVLGLRLLRRRADKAWKAFKQSAVSSFTFVETMGLGYFAKIAGDALGLTRPVPDPSRDGLDPFVVSRVGPRLEPRIVGGRATGFDADRRVAMAEAVLRAMSMTENFGRLVMLTGHGSTTVNNPHASGLDCGACGGHTGEANARVAAAILNDAGVRVGLAARGIAIPADTWFLGCLHDTTTDEIRIYNEEAVPASHREDLSQLKAWLKKASQLARAERATLLKVERNALTDVRVLARSRDWSEVRPEWGLAGNAAFVAAPRERTAGLDLGGRSFLHNYDWRKDDGFGVLELIMTAPMVVASWINLQYYGSTVNNRLFGSGNKTLHNVVGALGVLEGNAGDLKTGLPWQSVHDGERFVHEPLRLNVFLEAPEEAINSIIVKHGGVRDLVDNGWVHLYAFADEGRTIRRYRGGLVWETISGATSPVNREAA
jgi:uncharacterized protein YbcC (UPF0753/DUF2309 family)